MTSFFPITASDFGPFDSNNTGCIAMTALPITATASNESQRDHSRTGFERSNATGITRAKRTPITMEGILLFTSSHLATAKPSNSDNPLMRHRRVASFTFGPNSAENLSRPIHIEAGANPTRSRNTRTSNGDNLAAEKTVVFFPYRSSKGWATAIVDKAK